MERRMRIVIMGMGLVVFGLITIILGKQFISWLLQGLLLWLDFLEEGDNQVRACVLENEEK